MSKKILAILMAVAMAFSLLPVTAFATGETSGTTTGDVVDGHYDGSTWTEGAPARTDGLKDTVTTVNKTAKKVADNQYEVTLKVEMKYMETAVPPGAAATVLVIDKSGSMNENNRLPAAKTAAINFLKSYSGFSDSDFNTNGSLKNNVSNKNLKRYVSLVTFNDSASVKQNWIDVSTKDGYQKLVNAINGIKASDGTNLDAALRLADTQMQSDSITQIDKSKRNVIALTDGVPTYYVGTGWLGNDENVSQHGGYGCPDTNAATARSADALKAKVNVYTVCFGAAQDKCWTKDSVHAEHYFSPDEVHDTDGPTVGDFLKESIATPSTSNKQYAYNADDAENLYQAFAAITQTITDGLKEGVVTDGLPAGVTAVEGSGFETTWNLDSSSVTPTTSNGYNVYTYTKTYKVNVNPAKVSTVKVGEVNYAPLNTPTILTVQNGSEEVKIPFPIPAGKVTYSLTGFNKELVTEADNFSNPPEGVTIPENANSTVTVGENGVTLLYKITVNGDKGAKFTVRDDGATPVSPKDDTITTGDNSTFSGTVGDTGTTVFYVSKHFNIDADTQTVSNTAIIAPGDNAKGPDNDTATETTTVEKEKPTYTLTYDANGGKFGSDDTKTETIDKTGDHALNYTSDYIPAYTSEGKKIVFLGWSTNQQNKVFSKSDVNTAKTIASSIITKVNIPSVQTVYAVWSLDENNNNIPDIFEATVTYKIENGYWFRSEDGKNIDKNDKNVTITLYEKSGHIWQKIDAKLGDTIPTGHGGEKGYTAQGWYKNSETDTVNIEAATPVTGNVTYTFKYTNASIPTTYTVVLHLENGAYTTVPDGYTTTSTSGVYQYTVTEPTTIIKPDTTTLSRSGYDFQGWSLSKTDSQTLIEENETFTALYVKQSGLTGNYDKIDLYAVWKEAEVPTPSDPVELDVSRSKIASGLTKNWTTDVTLSIPSSEKQLVSDVLFILDESSCSESVKTSVNAMLDDLYRQIENSGAKIKVGAVQFRGNVTKLPLAELTNETKTEITSFMSSRPSVGGTNMSAGLLEAQKMLDNDTDVMDGRKYVILVSDGITYIWDDETTDAQENFGVNFANADSPNKAILAGPDGWDVKYGKSYIPENWENHFNAIGNMVSKTIQDKASNYERDDNATTAKPFVAYGEKEQYASTVDIALYKSYKAYEALQGKYKTYSVCSGAEKDMKDFPFGPSFMTYLADGKNVTFDSIQNDILYAVSAGSTVTDTIGEKFTFGGVDSFTLTVRGKELEKSVDGNTVNFGNVKQDKSYPYTVTYTPDTKTFVWTINENVSNFAPVQLTYTVKLTKPETAAGTYGVKDLNGDEKVDDTGAAFTDTDKKNALYTNESATMVPKDSNGNKGETLTFPKPSVSYTIKSSSGSHSGGSRPSLNTKDHYGYIIGYPVDYYTGQPTTDQTKKPVRPEGKITRAEVATIYFRMLTDESRTKFWSQSNAYSDVKTGDWFNNAVSTLSNAGIIAGYEDGSFRPNGYITRAEFATIAARFFDVTYNGKDLFPDISGHWAKDYINQAANKGFVNGYEDGTFKPDRNITRAEAVTLVNRTLDRHPDKNHFTKDMLVWPDNMDQTKWYYADMQEATNSHTYQMKENSDKTKYENWTKTLPIRNWEALEKAWSNANSSQGNGNVV